MPPSCMAAEDTMTYIGNAKDDIFICLGFGFIGRGLRIIIEYQVIEHLLCIGTHAITI